ncbi:hypothetical protein [Wolbachia endosymbiont of Wuchereria bancrofti]|uniref:hypothetical protein n=1 Tax=Wolbachia endosymbiont of Wuchereria bancrofti TaxID=96496 RepID=UPI000B4D89DA|nr:hypothetical protein [Wolbachia endosymbiont of Wuchereria bancrofti]
MQVGQLECEKNNSFHYTEELRDENKKLKEEKGNLQGQLCKMELYNLRREYDNSSCKLQEKVSSLNDQVTMLEEEKRQLEIG